MSLHITFRWIDGPLISDAEWEVEYARLRPIIEARGWMHLNRNTARVLVCEDAGSIAGFVVFQALPSVGPTWLHPGLRGSGVADIMAQQMWEFLMQSDARGWVATAETDHGEEMCKKFGMEKSPYPLYIKVNNGEVQ